MPTSHSVPLHPDRRRFMAGLGASLLLAGCMRRPAPAADPRVAYYTCAMHPSVRSQDPKGHCPICGMSLIPVYKDKDKDKDAAAAAGAAAADTETSPFNVAPERLQQIGARWETVERKPLSRPLGAPASVELDEAGLRDINVKAAGYVVKLHADYVGKPVVRGQPLMTVLTEGWIDAQLDYIRAYRSYARTADAGMPFNGNSRLVFDQIERMRMRLRVWDLSDAQIAELERFALTMKETDLRSGRGLKGTFDVLSPVTGIVREKTAVEGMRFDAGQTLLQVADLSTVWVQAAFPEDQVRYVAPGQEFEVRFPAFPDRRTTARVSFITPFFSDQTRRQTVRFTVANPDGQLSPGMYANVEGRQAAGSRLAVPASAVMPTGNRYVVFLDRGDGRLEPRFIRVEERLGDDYAVASGLAEGDRVLASANFLIDAESRVQDALRSWGESHPEQGAPSAP